MKQVFGLLLATAGLAYGLQEPERPLSRADQATDARQLLPLGEVPTPADNPTTPGKVALGRRLFFEKVLSGTNTMSCGTCHDPKLGWADAQRLSKGDGQNTLGRHTPSLINVAYNSTQFWDGRAGSLEEQALNPIENPQEMNQNVDEALKELVAKGYEPEFQKVFGSGVTKENLARALATFQRTIVQNETPFDRWIRGDEKAMSYGAVRGLLLFTTKGRCVACHSGPNFTNASHKFGNAFINIGVKPVPGDPVDEGRMAVLTDERQKRNKNFIGAFKTPSLRGVGLTAPYMHNGSLKTLEDVVEFYSRGGDAGKLRPTRFTEQEKKYVVEFLRHGLTSKP
jgi:cytochrome c peroxidase